MNRLIQFAVALWAMGALAILLSIAFTLLVSP